MCLQHTEFRKVLTDEKFSEEICAVIIDEAHCISQWGGDFRKMYACLDKLRAFFPPHIPCLATSATLPPLALREVRSKLAIDPDTAFFVNLGNDRPNIAMFAQEINSSDDYEALRPLLTGGVSSHGDLQKTIVFANTVIGTQTTCKKVRLFFPKPLRKYVDYLHSLRTPAAKKRVMRRFRRGKVMILIATEAAGMVSSNLVLYNRASLTLPDQGADIPDIKQVIQFGVPSSLSVWIQRAGCAGRSAEIEARAILLYEKSIFRWQKKGRKKVNDEDEEGSDNSSSEDGEDSGCEAGGDNERYEWAKKVEPELREWIATTKCRRDVADEHFDNPIDRKRECHLNSSCSKLTSHLAPLRECCDNCSRRDMAQTVSDEERPVTPNAQAESSTEHTTPSKSTNANGKRRMERSKDGPSTRRGEHLQNARKVLEHWRFNTKQTRYTLGSVTAEVIMPNPTLTTLASNARIRTIDDMEAMLNPLWIMARRHGEEVLGILHEIDEQEKAARERAKQVNAAARQAVTVARHAEKKRLKDEEQAAKEQAKMAIRAEKERLEARRKAERAAEQAEKQRLRAEIQAKKPKRPRRPALVGSSVFNSGGTSLAPTVSQCQLT
jgi:superfamily II DNA helicase RecQ